MFLTFNKDGAILFVERNSMKGATKMTCTGKLQGKMRESGHTIKTLSTLLGLSATGLFNKIHNKKEFLVSEVDAIAKILNLSDFEMQSIFFAKKGE